MELSWKVRNRLRTGGRVAAEVVPRSAGQRAWVVVTPILLEDPLGPEDSGCVFREQRLTSSIAENLLRGFQVARVEVPETVIQQILDDCPTKQGIATMESTVVVSEDEIGSATAMWHVDPADLSHPLHLPGLELVLSQLAYLVNRPFRGPDRPTPSQFSGPRLR